MSKSKIKSVQVVVTMEDGSVMELVDRYMQVTEFKCDVKYDIGRIYVCYGLSANHVNDTSTFRLNLSLVGRPSCKESE